MDTAVSPVLIVELVVIALMIPILISTYRIASDTRKIAERVKERTSDFLAIAEEFDRTGDVEAFSAALERHCARFDGEVEED